MRKQAVRICLVLLSLLTPAFGFDATVVDNTDQTLEVRNIQAQGQPPREYLPVVTETWAYDIHFSQIKDVKLDTSAKKKNPNDPAPFAVTLASGTVVKGTVNVNFTGESDFGKADLAPANVKSITFKKGGQDVDFKPSKEGPAATVKDTEGNSVQLTAARFHKGNRGQVVNEISGTRGAVTLSISTDDIEKIESAGQVKAQYGTNTKWTVFLTSGKSTELVLTQAYCLTGDYESGEATLSSDKLQSAVFEKKK